MMCVLVSGEALNKVRNFFISRMIIQPPPNQFHINLPTLRMNTRGYSKLSAYFFRDTQFHDLEGGKRLVKLIIFGVSIKTSSKFFGILWNHLKRTKDEVIDSSSVSSIVREKHKNSLPCSS
jgi:hypothetical protein